MCKYKMGSLMILARFLLNDMKEKERENIPEGCVSLARTDRISFNGHQAFTENRSTVLRYL